MTGLALGMALLLSALQPAAGAREAIDRAELERLNSVWLRSYETRDRFALDGVLADDFLGLYGDALLSKKQLLDGLATRPQTRVSWKNLRISLSGDTAIVDAISTITTNPGAAERSARYHYVDVYSRRAGGWRAIASHVVKMPG